MKCKTCGKPMVQLFMSWACDYCEGKHPEVKSATGYSKASRWLALRGADGREISGLGYRRAKTETCWSVAWVVTFPTAAGDWGFIQSAALMDAEEGGNLLAEITLIWTRQIGSGDTVNITGG